MKLRGSRLICLSPLALVLSAMGTVPARAQADMTLPESYSTAEEWFHWLEHWQGYGPSDPATQLGEGYYHRCYTNGECFGVRLDSPDGYAYRKEGDKAWERTGALEELQASFSDLPVQLLGMPHGNLSDNLYAVRPAAGADRNRAPLILGDKKWTARDRQRIRRAFKEGVPIVMLDATAEKLARLNKLLRKVSRHSSWAVLPDGVQAYEVYAVDRDRYGSVYELKILPPPADSPPVIIETPAGGDAAGTATPEGTTPSADTDAVEAIRVGILMEWLKGDADRDGAAQPLRTEGEADDKFKDMAELVRATESRSVFTFLKNVHQITTTVWGIYNALTDEDWFYVRQKGTLAASNEIEERAKDPRNDHYYRGWFTNYYRFNTYVLGYWESTDKVVQLGQQSPETVNGKAKVSSSVSFSLNGKLFGNKKDGIGAEIGFGATINHTFTYKIQDVTVLNISGYGVTNAAWEFDIARPFHDTGSLGCITSQGLHPMTELSRATYEPVTQWFWRVADAPARNKHPASLPIIVNFRTRVEEIERAAFTCIFFARTKMSDLLGDTVYVPWPKRPNN
ncbi:MAG: hypothetical protein AB1648_06660 [Pseudomonadota bacterium]